MKLPEDKTRVIKVCCDRCEHTWIPKTKYPRVCPKCKSKWLNWVAVSLPELPKTTKLRISDHGFRACSRCHYVFSSRSRMRSCPKCKEPLEEYDPILPEDIAALFELDLTLEQRFHLLNATGVYLSGSRGWADALIRWITTGEELEYYLPDDEN